MRAQHDKRTGWPQKQSEATRTSTRWPCGPQPCTVSSNRSNAGCQHSTSVLDCPWSVDILTACCRREGAREWRYPSTTIVRSRVGDQSTQTPHSSNNRDRNLAHSLNFSGSLSAGPGSPRCIDPSGRTAPIPPGGPPAQAIRPLSDRRPKRFMGRMIQRKQPYVRSRATETLGGCGRKNDVDPNTAGAESSVMTSRRPPGKIRSTEAVPSIRNER